VELRPQRPRGRDLIEAYGEGRFRIGGAVFTGSVLIGLAGPQAWPVTALAGLSPDTILESLASLLGDDARPEIMLIGCGARAELLPVPLRARFKELKIVVEAMDTGAACRTYNVLVAEDRLVAAALVAV
jgi:uncharacterized protein